MVRTLLLLIAIYAAYKLYKRVFLEKRCSACEKKIRKEAAICYHCNTIQADGVIIESENLSRDAKVTPEASTGFVKLLRSPVALITLTIIVAIAVAGIYLFTEQ